MQHFTWTHLNLEWHVWNMCKTLLKVTHFVCTPSFLVCARLTTCTSAHSLEGTLLRTVMWVNKSALRVNKVLYSYAYKLRTPCTKVLELKMLIKWDRRYMQVFLSLHGAAPEYLRDCALGLIPPRPGYDYDHWRGLIVCGGWWRISAIVHSLLPVLDVGTVSFLLSAWLTQWTLLKPSLKLICLLRLTLVSCLWGALVAICLRYCAI